MIKLLLASYLIYFTSYFIEDGIASGKEEVEWISIEKAQELTRQDPRKIFIDMYADWCSWCKVMDRQTFNDPEVAAYIRENYYAVRLDVESEEIITFNGKQLSQRDLARSLKVQGLPTIVFVDEEFKKIKPVAGYQDAPQFLKSLQKFNKK